MGLPIAYNLRLLRSARRLSQKKVAQAAGISVTAYQNIESGRAEPKVSTLQSIARALDVRLEDLVVPAPVLKGVRFRAFKRLKRREQVIVDVARRLADYNALEEMLGERRPYLLEDLTHSEAVLACPRGIQRAIAAAEATRNALGLGPDEPIRDICGLLEKAGVKVLPVSVASDGFFGLSVAPWDGGPAIAVNVWEQISVERWIFTAAHELGHLLLHLSAYDVSQVEEDSGEEEEANAFASYFLMPQPVFRREWQKTVGLPFVERVMKVKGIFHVSYRTVLYRLAETTSLGDDAWRLFNYRYRRVRGESLQAAQEPEPLAADSFQASLAEPLRRREPEAISRWDFVPARLDGLVRKAIETEQITVGRAAEILRIPHEEMRARMASWVS